MFSNLDAAVKARDDACQQAMFSNAKLRLLMTLVKFERLGVEDLPGASWVIPSTPRAQDLREMKSFIDKYLEKAMRGTLGRDPRELIRRKYGGRKPADIQDNPDIHFGSDSEGEDEVPDGPLFPPNPRSRANPVKEPKKKRKRKERNADDEDEDNAVDEETLEERRRARQENTRARLAKIKSDLYVHASDEDTDEEADKEFFLLEEKRRKEQAQRVKKALLTGIPEDVDGATNKRRQGKRQHNRPSTRMGEAQSKRPRRGDQTDEDAEDDDVVMEETDASSPQAPSEGTPSHEAEDEFDFDDDLAFGRDRGKTLESSGDKNLDSKGPDAAVAPDEDEDAPVAATSRRRMRAGFVVDSDSE